jgi:ribonuclease HI
MKMYDCSLEWLWERRAQSRTVLADAQRLIRSIDDEAAEKAGLEAQSINGAQVRAKSLWKHRQSIFYISPILL